MAHLHRSTLKSQARQQIKSHRGKKVPPTARIFRKHIWSAAAPSVRWQLTSLRSCTTKRRYRRMVKQENAFACTVPSSSSTLACCTDRCCSSPWTVIIGSDGQRCVEWHRSRDGQESESKIRRAGRSCRLGFGDKLVSAVPD